MPLTQNDIQQIREVIQEENKPIKKKLNKVAKDLNMVIKVFDKGIVENKREIAKVKQFVGYTAQ